VLGEIVLKTYKSTSVSVKKDLKYKWNCFWKKSIWNTFWSV